MTGPAVLSRPPTLRRDFRCVHCGYGISVALTPRRCPMCGAASSWQSSAVPGRTPFGRTGRDG